MKRLWKMVPICLLALVLVLGITLLTPKAEAAGIVGSGTCDENLTWTLDNEGTLTISGTGQMDNYLGYPWEGYLSDIKTVVIESGVTSIGIGAFRDYSNLTGISIPDSIASIGNYAFDGCTNLTYNIYDNAKYLGNDQNPYVALISAVSTDITTCQIHPNTKTIGGQAFYDCAKLTGISIPDSATTIDDYAFWKCFSLRSVTIPDSVATIGYFAFSGCYSLESITIPDSVTSIGAAAFSGCSSLISITIPDSVTAIGNYAFSNCSSLTGIWVNAKNPNYCSDESGVLYTKDMTTLIQAPGAINGYYTIPDSVTIVGDEAFLSCSSLTSITIPDSVISIGDSAFYGCYNLQTVTIPNSVISIGDCAFWYCFSLQCVTIGDSVTAIGYYAFSDCSSLTDVYYAGTETQWDNISNAGGNEPLLNATIHYNYVQTETVPGDLNGDDAVNNDDVVLLLWHTLFPLDYPLKVNGDLNNDSEVNNEDVVLLLWHTLFPEDYPL